MWPNRQETADLGTFTEENLNGKLHFLCSGSWKETTQSKLKMLGIKLDNKFPNNRMIY